MAVMTKMSSIRKFYQQHREAEKMIIQSEEKQTHRNRLCKTQMIEFLKRCILLKLEESSVQEDKVEQRSERNGRE